MGDGGRLSVLRPGLLLDDEVREWDGPAVAAAGIDGGALEQAAKGGVVRRLGAGEAGEQEEVERGGGGFLEFDDDVEQFGFRHLLEQGGAQVLAQLGGDLGGGLGEVGVVEAEGGGTDKTAGEHGDVGLEEVGTGNPAAQAAAVGELNVLGGDVADLGEGTAVEQDPLALATGEPGFLETGRARSEAGELLERQAQAGAGGDGPRVSG